MSIEAMKQALAKFEHLWEIGIDAVYKVELLPEIRALRQAIEEAEYDKLTVKFGERAKQYLVETKNCWEQLYQPKYTPYGLRADESGKLSIGELPRKEWVGLTELEVKHYNNRLSGSNVAQEIESKLRERNT